ncbi:NUDIX hydrolase [Caenimonas terrae]|uniref:NUDIX hydrolase n=1 Tax=Caenimonas terrae TaxID=696074 RepID=A0ABW0NH95_9BURK
MPGELQADLALRQQVQRALREHSVHAADIGAHRAAAVAVAICEEGMGADLPGIAAPAAWSTQAALLLTRRAQGLRNHGGQWALPGGRIEPGESAEQAALREMAEEVGLLLDPAAVLGRLDDFSSRSGFVITPVVVWAGSARKLAPNPSEVASIHRIPLAEFLRTDAPMLEALEGSEHPVLRMPVGERAIAAPTAAVLYQFREVCLLGRATRVAHFEQPLFARK